MYMHVHACTLVCVHTLKFSLMIHVVFLPFQSCPVDVQKEVAIDNSLETSGHEFVNRISLLCYFVSH